MRSQEALKKYIQLLNEQINEVESMKGKDLDYWLAHFGGVVKKRADSSMEILGLLAGKVGDNVKKTYDASSSVIAEFQSNNQYNTLQNGLDALKKDQVISSEESVLVTIGQSIADLKRGDVSAASERLFNLNPIHNAIESLKKSKENQRSNHDALNRKDALIDDQISKWKEEIKKAKSEINQLEGYSTNSQSKYSFDKSKSELSEIMNEIYSNLDLLKSNIR